MYYDILVGSYKISPVPADIVIGFVNRRYERTSTRARQGRVFFLVSVSFFLWGGLPTLLQWHYHTILAHQHLPLSFSASSSSLFVGSCNLCPLVYFFTPWGLHILVAPTGLSDELWFQPQGGPFSKLSFVHYFLRPASFSFYCCILTGFFKPLLVVNNLSLVDKS